jgi:hypothetical protein
MTRAEIDAMRTVLVAAVSTINAHPVLRADFVSQIRAGKEADIAVALATSMTDEMLQQRAEWISRLLPPDLRKLIE